MIFQYCIMMNLEFRRNLRDELDYQKITVKELSEKTGIPKPTLECYLGARANQPTLENAVVIARALGVSVEYLATSKNNELELELYRNVLEDLSILSIEIRDLIITLIKLAATRQRKNQAA